MNDNQDKINLLLEKLDSLVKQQESFAKEINHLHEEINQIKQHEISITPEPEKVEDKPEAIPIKQEPTEVIEKQPTQAVKQEPVVTKKKSPIKVKSNIEKFIGENLINKVGIIIIIIGVGIGAKYAIENYQITPVTRIILGYLVGLGLLGFAFFMKKKYENFSAVLLSGSMAIMYFITFFAYNYYNIIPQMFAFALMLVFTFFTVLSAINYNKQIIAHIGLVGAYAVPFLLSDGSGHVSVLFSYMVIINIGILVLAFIKYWKALNYSSFILTWLIYTAWFLEDFNIEEYFGLSSIFLLLFFITFYLTFLAYKLIKKEKFNKENILLILSNSFIFYGFGYAILSNHESGESFLGLFTLFNAIIHFGVSVVIFKQKLADRNLFYLVSGLVLVFITMAVPVQLDGNWVSLLWVGEAALLFWIGRTKNVPVYEKISYALMYLAFFSIFQDWISAYDNYNPEIAGTRIIPIFNINFLTSVLFIASFGFINFIYYNKKYELPLNVKKFISGLIHYSIPAFLIIILYYSFRFELATFWNQLFTDSFIEIQQEGEEYMQYYSDYDLSKFKIIWLINYTLLFFSILSFANIKKLKNKLLGSINLGLNAIILIIFLTHGLYLLSELRESYLDQYLAEYYNRTAFNIGIRYISFAFVALILFCCYTYIKQIFSKSNLRIIFDLVLHTSIVWIASSELINWLDIFESAQSYKLGLSILWGIYALLLIVLGIWKNKKHLRIGAISFFGVTLIKLFFYDISHLDTIAKTIVFLSLGILLLIISFLYNKYKNLIFDEHES